MPKQLVEYVNILQGTDSKYEFSHGNTLPLVGLPWGMVDWAMQNGEGGWFFQPTGKIDGIRATHLPSPWIGDYGQFVLMPQSGPLRMEASARATAYDTTTAILQPDYVRLDLERDTIRVELTGTERCGVFRLTYRDGRSGRLILNSFGASELKIEGRTIYGISRATSGGTPDNFASYFVIELDRDITTSEIFPGTALPVLAQLGLTKPKDVSGYVEFDTSADDPVLIKVGTSFIGWAQAERNLRAETEGDFEAVHDRVSAIWNANLGKIEIEATEDQKKTFYSCLYRAQMFPHRLYELDAAGQPIHYSPYDGKVHAGVLYGDIGIWDAFRTTFPLLTLIYPAQFDEILQGFVNASAEGDGTIPEWPSPGYRVGMIGQHSAAIFADAAAKGHTHFDAAKAYASLRKSAFAPPLHQEMVRDGMATYLKLGYTTDEVRYSVSTTLDYAYDDWCVAQMARKLGHPDDAEALMARAQNYRKIWDPHVGFMRAKDAAGHWVEPFDPFAWGGPYAECGAWQASWFVPHDPAGLAGLLGGRAAFAAKLDQLMELPPTYHLGGYPETIHEMVEMAAIPFGQCSLNNQPSFSIPYLFAVIGEPWKTQYWTRRACAELYSSSPQGFSGDEDNGSMASWYLLSAMGMFPFCPGAPEYIVTSPLFPRLTLHLTEGKTLVITAPGNSDANVYIQKRTFNGREETTTWIRHQDLMQGGSLEFEMGPKPKIESVRDEDLPYSASREKSAS